MRNRVLYDYIVVVFLMLFVVMLSFFFFSGQSLRLDEAQSLWQTSHTPERILEIVAQDVHVPLYHMLLHFWQLIFGNDVVFGRAFSMIFFALSIPSMYMLGKEIYGRGIGLFTAILVAVSPFLNWYGNEIRMYSLLTFFVILNQYFFLRIYRRPFKGAWLLWGLTAVLGFYTHYFFWFVIISQSIYFFLHRSLFPHRSFRKFTGYVVVFVLAFAPWAYYVYSLGGAENSRPLLQMPTTINLFNTFSQFMFGFQGDKLNTILVSLWPLAVLLAVLAIQKNKRMAPETLYCLISLLVPITLVFVVSILVQPFFVTRYLIITVPALYLVLGWILYTYPKILRRIVQVGLLVIMLSGVAVQAVGEDVPVKENYREASAYLERRASPQDIVILSAPFTIYPFEYYYAGSADVNTLPIWNRNAVGPIPPFSSEKLPIEVEKLRARHQVAWLLLSYDQGYEADVKLYFDTHFHRLDQQNFSPGLNLYAYKLRYDNPDVEALINAHASAGSSTETGEISPSESSTE